MAPERRASRALQSPGQPHWVGPRAEGVSFPPHHVAAEVVLRRWPLVLSVALIGLWVPLALVPTGHRGPNCGGKAPLLVAVSGSSAGADVEGLCQSIAQSYLSFHTVTLLIAPAVILGWWLRGYRRARHAPASDTLLDRGGPRIWPAVLGLLVIGLALGSMFLPIDEDTGYGCGARPMVALAVGTEGEAPGSCQDSARDAMVGLSGLPLAIGVPLLVWGDRGRRNAARAGKRSRVRSGLGGRVTASMRSGDDDVHRTPSSVQPGSRRSRAHAGAIPVATFLRVMTRTSRGVSVAMVFGVGVLFVLLPEPDLVVTGFGTVVMVWTWNWALRRLRDLAEAPHRPATLVTAKRVTGALRACVADVSMEDGTVKRVSLHTDGKPPAEFTVALLPDGKVVRVSKNEQLGIPLSMFAVGVMFCATGLAGVGVAELVQSSSG
jgi:hypothetical protein